ncbi:hypothetical protein CCYA_CCYA11G3122 [Cyanidiococcus yangmingshanensis]|nr:hypothetical protein CCYA_CCYA11G3122 [Cyanidiococcus yangmingshanensis]
MMSTLLMKADLLFQHATQAYNYVLAEAELFGASYLALPAFFDHAVARITELGIASEREIRFLLLLLLAYVFAFVYRCLRSPRWRHVFSVCAGAALGQTFCGATGWLYPLLAALVSFQFIHVLGPSRAAPAVFVFNLLFLFALHLHRQLTDPFGWHLDATFMQMIVTQKLSALALNLSDGLEKPSRVDSQSTRNQNAVRKTPSMLELLAFVFFPPCFLMGPTIEYMDWYQNAHDFLPSQLHNRQSTGSAPAGAAPNARPSIRSSVAASSLRFLQALLFLTCFQAANAKFPSDLLADAGWLQQHRASGIFWLYMRIWLSLLGLRCKYYFGFKIAEGAAIMSGVGFTGYLTPSTRELNPRQTATTLRRESLETSARFDRVTTIDVLGFELAGSIRDAAAAWNKPTNTWLRRYVYERLPRRYQLDLYGTYVVSALWHGIAPGYYMFFVTSAFLTSLERQWRRVLRDLGLDRKIQQHLVLSVAVRTFTWAWTSAMLNYFIISFVVLTSDRSYLVWSTLSWWGHKLLLLELIITMFVRILTLLATNAAHAARPKPTPETTRRKIDE